MRSINVTTTAREMKNTPDQEFKIKNLNANKVALADYLSELEKLTRSLTRRTLELHLSIAYNNSSPSKQDQENKMYGEYNALIAEFNKLEKPILK